jgi:hypothetical protein
MGILYLIFGCAKSYGNRSSCDGRNTNNSGNHPVRSRDFRVNAHDFTLLTRDVLKNLQDSSWPHCKTFLRLGHISMVPLLNYLQSSLLEFRLTMSTNLFVFFLFEIHKIKYKRKSLYLLFTNMSVFHYKIKTKGENNS